MRWGTISESWRTPSAGQSSAGRWTGRTFIKRLDELRLIRNNVMHFNPEPLPANTVDRLRYILKLLRDFGG